MLPDMQLLSPLQTAFAASPHDQFIHPRRPARPAICKNSEGFSSRCPLSVRLERVEITVVAAGILIPAAKVSVSKYYFNQTLLDSSSTKPFQAGKIPA
jgi:hypothetical protein